MDMNNSSSIKAHKETNLEELMSHHHLHEEQSLNELHKEYRQVHDDSKRLQYKVEKSQAHQVRLNESHSDTKSAEWEARAKMNQNKQYTKDLQQQQKDCQFEGTLLEQKIQKGLVKNVAEEQGREFHMRQVAFEGEQREKKQREKEIVVEEERQRGVYNLATDDRNAATVAERDRKILERGNQSKILGDILVADGVARQEREDKMNLIQEKEMFEKRADHDYSERERLEHSIEEIEKSNISQFRFKQSAAVEMQKEENRFRMESEKLMAMQDEMQLQKDRLKRERNHQYSVDLQAQIAENSRRREAEKKSEQAWAQDQFDSNQEWRSHAQEDGRKIHYEEFEVPQAVSNHGSDAAKYDDNVRQSETQQALEENLEQENERKKRERNHQYSLDLQAQIADNARRRQAKKDYEQEEYERNEQWRSHAQEDGRKIHYEEFEVPQAVSNHGSDVAKYDDNVRQSETQQALEEENIEQENERKKEERNHQYSLDLQAQIADNARRRQAEKEYEQGEYERNEQWRDKASEERRKVFEEKNMNVGWDEQPVVRRRNAQEGDFNH